jgi:hypothetical protein
MPPAEKAVMSKGVGLAVGIFGAVLMAGPMLAQAHPGGGGHGGGGGHVSAGHSGGGGHAAASPHFSGGGGGAHFASAAHYSGGGVRAAGGAAGAYHGAARGYAGGYSGAAYRGGSAGYGGAYRGSAYAGRGYGGGYGGYRGGYHGYSAGANWRGGYWRGGYWPRAFYGAGYSWFLGALPLAYATYWYGGIPYYYANNLYYTWSPDYSGYVATDPPPVADSSGAAPALPPTDMQYQGDPNAQAAPPPPQAGAADFSQGQPAPQEGQAPPQDQPVAQAQQPRMFMYPKSGQTEDQQRTDKLECEKWASDQVGLGSNGPDYQRAMGACIQGRGYSVN